jgi:phage FluMu protein Com
MIDVRCGKCRKKLAEGVFTELSIKCPRCLTLNLKTYESPTSAARPPNQEAQHGQINQTARQERL